MGRPRGLPSWHQGEKVEDDISGEEIFTKANSSSKLVRIRRGLKVGKKSYDSLTTEEREQRKLKPRD